MQLVVSDAYLGPLESASEFYPEARWRRCIVHWCYSVFSHVPATNARKVVAMLKAMHTREYRQAA